jgi:hypothetical protein
MLKISIFATLAALLLAGCTTPAPASPPATSPAAEHRSESVSFRLPSNLRTAGGAGIQGNPTHVFGNRTILGFDLTVQPDPSPPTAQTDPISTVAAVAECSGRDCPAAVLATAKAPWPARLYWSGRLPADDEVVIRMRYDGPVPPTPLATMGSGGDYHFSGNLTVATS